MSTNIPNDLRYTKDHEWAREEEADTIAVGITDYAQDALGDVTYVELPEVGDDVSAGDGFGVVESVKTFSDLYAPVDGEVVAINEDVVDDPSILNSDPYGKGWLIKIKMNDGCDLRELMDAAAYTKHVEEAG